MKIEHKEREKRSRKGGKKGKQQKQPKQHKEIPLDWQRRRGKNNRKRTQRNRLVRDDLSFRPPNIGEISSGKAEPEGPMMATRSFSSEKEGMLFGAVERLANAINGFRERNGGQKFKEWAKDNGMSLEEAMAFVRLRACPNSEVSESLGCGITVFFGIGADDQMHLADTLMSSLEERAKNPDSRSFEETTGKRMLEQRKTIAGLAVQIGSQVKEVAEMQGSAIAEVCRDFGLDEKEVGVFGGLGSGDGWREVASAFQLPMSEIDVERKKFRLETACSKLKKITDAKHEIPSIAKEVCGTFRELAALTGKSVQDFGDEVLLKKEVVGAFERAGSMNGNEAFQTLMGVAQGWTLSEKVGWFHLVKKVVGEMAEGKFFDIAVSDLKEVIKGISELEGIRGKSFRYDLERVLGTSWRESNAIDEAMSGGRMYGGDPCGNAVRDYFGKGGAEKVKRIREIKETLAASIETEKKNKEMEKELVSEMERLAGNVLKMLGDKDATATLMEKLFELDFMEADVLADKIRWMKSDRLAETECKDAVALFMRQLKNEEKLELLGNMNSALEGFMQKHGEEALSNVASGCLREFGYKPVVAIDSFRSIMDILTPRTQAGKRGGYGYGGGPL